VADDANLIAGSYTVTEDISTSVNSLTIPNSSITFTVASDSVFNTLGALNFSGGAFNAAGSVNGGGLNFSGGTIYGPGSINLSGSNTWSGGVFNFGTPGTLTLQAGGTLNMVGSADHDLPGWRYNVNGTNLHTGGRVRGGYGAMINNAGLWLEEVDQVFNNDYNSTAMIFVNTGTFEKTTTSGTTSFNAPIMLLNSGLVDVESGTISIAGGGTNSGTFNAATNALNNFIAAYTFNDGTTFTGAGADSWNGSILTVNGRITSTNASNWQWTSGRIAGTMTVASASTLNIVSGADHDLPGVLFTNNGVVVHTGGRVRGGVGTVIANAALWLDEVDQVINDDYAGGVSIFLNTGTFRKSGTSGVTTFNTSVLLNNTGLVDVESGSINLSGGGTNSGTFNAAVGTVNNFISPYTFNDGSAFTGTGADVWNTSPITVNGAIVSTNASTWQWNAGRITGTLSIPSGTTLNIISGNDHDMPGMPMTNNGVIVHTGGRVRGGVGTIIANNSLWLEEVDQTINDDFAGGVSIFANTGTFRKTGTSGTTTFNPSVLLNNSGLVDTESGTINISGGGANSGAFNAATNTQNNFTASYAFNDGSVFNGTGLDTWSSGTFTLNGTLTSTNAATLQWNAGTVVGTFSIPAGSTLNIVSGNAHSMSGTAFTNNGTVYDSGGQIRGGNGWTIYNNNLWVEAVDNYFYNDGGGINTIVNSGIFRKTAGAGTTTIGLNGSAVLLNNSGLVDAEAGTIQIAGGGTNIGTFNAASNAACNVTAAYTFNDGTLFTGGGLSYLSGGTIHFNGNTTASNLQFNGATTVGPGFISLLGTNYWASGTVGAIVTISNGSTLNIITGNAHYLSGGILTNNGTVMDTGGQIRGSGGWSIYNNSLWVEAVDNFFYNDGGGVDTIVNAGTFRKTANTEATIIGYNGTTVLLNNTGLVDAQSGTIQINGGGSNTGTFNAATNAACSFTANYTFADGTLFTGGGLNYLSGGSIGFNGNTTASNVQFNGATTTGTGLITLRGTNNYWAGGTMGEIVTVSSGSTLNIITGNPHYLSGGVLTNNGTVNDTGGQIRGSGGWTIYNNGLWLEAVDNFFYNDGGGLDKLVNTGTFRKTAATGTTIIGYNGTAVVLNNSGVVDAQNGEIQIVSGGTNSGTFNAALGADNNFTGSYAFNNGSTFTGLGQSYLTGGTLTFNGSITSSNLNWQNGVVAGTLINSYGSTLYVGSGNNHDLPGAVLQNYGTVIHTGGRIRQGHAGLLDNEGLWLEQVDTDFNDSEYGGATSTFLNNGTFNKNTTIGTTTFDAGFPFNNNGLLEVLCGTFNFVGAYNPSGATLLFGVSNLTSYGSVNITGAAPLGGTLGLQLLGGFVPAVSNVISPLSYGSHSGTFSAFNLPAVPGGETWITGYGSRSVSLTVSGAATNDNFHISGTVTDIHGNPVVGANVVAAIDPASFPNLIQNGDFETPSDGSTQYVLYNVGSAGITGWTVFGSLGENVDIVGPAYGLQAQNGSQFFDPTGNTGGAGITQTFATISNQSYVLSFYQGTLTQHGTANALGVTIGTNFVFFPETAGSSANLAWTQRRIPFTATSNFTTVSFQDDTGANSDNSLVDNVVVGPPDYGTVLGAVTDSGGHYQIAVGNGTFQVGVNGLTGLGFNPVTNQSVTVAITDGTANFVVSPFSGQVYTISAMVNPPGAGNIAGGGSFPQNSTVSLTATPVSVPPYVFVNWTENGYFQSAASNYSFTVTRGRQLVANFTLPLYSLTASNDPPGAGTVTGQGSYYYGTTNILTATPSFGYSFSNWTQGPVVLGASPSLNVGIYSNTVITANYTDANLAHAVTTATSPPGLTLVSGAGVYTNGQTASFVAPLEVTNPPNYYHFSEFTLSNTVISGQSGGSAQGCDPPPSGIAAWFPAEGNAQDIIGGNNGTLMGGVTFASGKVGQAFNFDGSSGWVDIPNSAALNPTGPFSVEFWVNGNPSQPYNLFLLVDKSHGFIDSAGWVVQGTSSDGTVGFGYGLGGGGSVNFIFASTTNNVLDNHWHHLAGVWTGTQLQMYMDGVMQGATSSSALPVNNQRDMEIGSSWGGGSRTRYFSGLIDEVSYYTRALTPSEVAAIYSGGTSGKCQGPPAAFTKTFSTLDPTNLQYVAVYTAQSILPLVRNVAVNFANPVPATTNLLLTVQFDRAMQTTPAPVILLTNSGAGAVQPVVPINGYWTSGAFPNDTYHVPAMTIGAGMDGTVQMFVSGAQDLNTNTLALTNVATLTVVSTPPANPVLSVTSSNSSSAVASWSGYSAPVNLAGFRVFIENTNFTAVTGLPSVTTLGSGPRSFNFGGLALDTPYYVAIQAFDVAGNVTPNVAPLPIFLPSTVPPPVSSQQTPVGSSTASLSWSSYNTANLFGFSGFRVYYATTNFTTVAGLVPAATLGASANSFSLGGLNRSNTYYFAVVGFNGTNGFNPAVTTVTWTDPYSGSITVNTTIGGGGQSVVSIYHAITVQNNAILTVQPGTTLLFAPGTGLTVQQGALLANGTALAPIIFDSARDVAGSPPQAGDWAGVTLGSGAGASILNFVEILYGGGLAVSGCAPTVGAFTAVNNTPFGLGLQNAATLATANALLTGNTVGLEQTDTAVLTITNSVIQNNGTNVVASGFSPMAAAMNWWGTPVENSLTNTFRGNVNYNPFLTYEPVLTPALGAVGGVTQIGTASASLQLACRTADSMRLSEDFTFTGVFFAPFTNLINFPLSAGGGLKHIYAQFRSVTGQTNPPIELDLNYITAGPVIQSFSLSQDETLNRPLTVTGSATAVLGMADIEFYVDGVLQSTNAGASFSYYFDISALPNAIHQVELLARDLSGNIATLTYDVVISLTPPLAPIIAVPGADILTNTDFVTVSGTAEPNIAIQLTRNGQIDGTTNADNGGNFTFANAVMVEGVNNIVAVASDHSGTTSSAVRHVTVETIPPVAPVLNAPVYHPGQGLALNWQFAASGKQPTTFQLFWNSSSFTSPAQAASHSPVLNTMGYTISGLANGTYYFAVVGYDDAGNPSPLSTLVTFAYDSSPPSLSISYSQPSPLGSGPFGIVLTSSKALAATPSLTFRPFGAASPVLLSLTNVALNTWQSGYVVTTATPSGFVSVLSAAQDLLGNVFTGAPLGPALIFATTPPAGVVATIPGPPVQATNNTNITVSLTLSELAAVGVTPTLNFLPPAGSGVPVSLSGSGSNWLGTLQLTPVMGSGFGRFTMTAEDALGNIGTNIVSGAQLEIYNTALPSPPPTPTGLTAISLPGGQVSLSWNSVSNAQIYRLYRESGASFTLPGVLDQDGLTTNAVLDLPPADGLYSYAISASRLGSESALSAGVLADSDRTGPPAPTNVIVTLAVSGVQITWQEPSGQIPNHYSVYRNGTLIQTVSTVTPVVDYPPRGLDSYVVAASDFLGNQSNSTPATINLPVSPVSSLSVLVATGQGPVLTWVSTDNTAVGFNIYRNGVKQNASLVTATTYADNLPLADGVVYGVTAVNNSAQESPPRQVNVYPVALGLLANPLGGASSNPLSIGYFDQFQVGVTNVGASAAFPLAQVSVTRTIANLAPLTITQSSSASIPAKSALPESLVFPESPSLSPQTLLVSAYQQTDSGDSSVVYQNTFNLTDVRTPASGVTVSANQLPLAGGLSAFQVQIYNRGYADMDIVVFRGGGAQPGDPYLSVQNGLGQEVSRASFTGAPAGTVLLPDGTGFVDVPAGASIVLTITNVLVPAALSGTTNTTFVAVITNIYNQIGTAGQTVSGPLSGSMVSSLAQTPYYGTAQTDKLNYVNNDSIVISGQALSTQNGAPVTNAALNIGFAAGGVRWYQPVTTDVSGNYQYTYSPPPGFGGTITIWAAHPLVVDQLNQAQVNVYRLYDNPSFGSIRFSQNDSLNFSIQLINPGPLPLTGLTTTFAAYQVSGNTQTPISTITGTNLTGAGFVLGGNQNRSINLQLSAAVNAPTSAQIVFTFTSAEGASTAFTGTVTLLPAVPVISVQTPPVGYLQVSVNRGAQRSGEISIVNSGLQTLQGITLVPPTNPWMQLNLPVSPDGKIHIPDLAVGQSNNFLVVFTPPSTLPLALYSDTVVIQGTNITAPYPSVNVYALVTSDQTGRVQFNVTDNLGQQVSGASVRLHNDLIQADVGPLTTGTNGLVTATNLEEGSWNWQVVAPGCGANAGSVNVVGGQTVSVATTLNRSLVTVTFNVVPVPFTDVYQIQVEQTFQTHVPVPVLVVNPPFVDLHSFGSGFQTNFTISVQNYGLVQISGLSIGAAQDNGGVLTPLITYIPVLLPFQTVDVPFSFSYNRPIQQVTVNVCVGQALPVQNTPNPDVYLGLASAFSGQAQNSDGSGGQTITADLSVIGVGTATNSSGSLENYIYASIGQVVNCIVSSGGGGGGLGGLGGGGGGGGSFGGGGGGYGGAAAYVPPANPVFTQAAACFAPETSVLMADGNVKPISEIQANDLVRSGVNAGDVAAVNAIYTLAAGRMCEIHLAPLAAGAPDHVLATEEHPFWVDGRGWLAARNLKSGDWLTDAQGRRVRILANQSVTRLGKVYSLSLSGDTAFYANGVLVRDTCGATPTPTLLKVSEVSK
jgi:hypothetical protein